MSRATFSLIMREILCRWMTIIRKVHELVKQALKIELQEIDEDNDSYKAKEKVARAFIAGLIVRSARDIKNRVVLRVFFVFPLPLCTLFYHCTRVGEC